MKNKVVFPELVAELATVTNTSDALCEAFLKELFSLVSAELSKGKSVRIKKMGEFSVLPDGTVHFEPDKDMSESLNAAFACFEPIELDDSVTDEELDKCGEVQTEETEPVPQVDEAENAVDEKEPEQVEPDIAIVVESVEEKDEETDDMKEKEESIGEMGEVGSAGVETMEPEPIDSEQSICVSQIGDDEGKRRFWHGYAWGVLTSVVVACTAFFVFHWEYIVSENDDSSEMMTETENVNLIENVPVEIDSAAIVPVAQEQELKTEENDTLPASVEVKEWPKTFEVTSTAYLSNVARKFYGHYAFWVYIYIENKDLIANPDNLPVGVVLSIPDPQKYDIDKNDPNSIKKAQLRAFEIKK